MNNISKVVFLLLFVSFCYVLAIDVEKNKASILKANNFSGYKGDIIIEVLNHDEGYGVENGAKNVGIKYKAYIEVTSKNNQKIRFDESKHAKEFEIRLNGKELMLFYDKKKIYDSKTMSEEDFENVMAKYEVYKYPYTITDFLHYSGGNSEYFPDYLLHSLLVESVAKNYYILASPENNYYVGIEVDNEYRLTSFFIEDFGSSYEWKNKVPYKISEGHMYESVITEYLDEDGWIKK